MRRYWIELSQIRGDQIYFSGESWHHIHVVCRQSVGHRFEVFWGGDKALVVELIKAVDREGIATTVEERKLPSRPEPRLVLCLSLPRLTKVDEILEKMVELGIDEVRPFTSDFSFIRSTKDLAPTRLERWERIIAGATRQTGRGDLLKVGSPTLLKNLFQEMNRKNEVKGLFCYEGEALVSLPEALAAIKSQKPKELWFFVGSEGGFSREEVTLFEAQKMSAVTLGHQILRVETACVALASILNYEFGFFTKGD